MALLKENRIKKLLQASYSNPVFTADYLRQLGISAQLCYDYVKKGWLKKIDNGVYQIPDQPVTWEQVVSALQQQLKLGIHVGAKTVFQLYGKTHYLKQTEKIYLFYPHNTHIPAWLKNPDFIKRHSLILYQGNVIQDWDLGLTKYNDLIVSSLERAILEHISFIRQSENFDESYKLLQGLTSLRSSLLQQLLEKCVSIKTKRIFLYFAEKANLPWFKKLNPKKIDLGKGSRQIGKGGKYISKYQIIVPELEDEL